MRRTPSRPWSHRLTALFLAVLFSLAGAREGIAGYVCVRHSDHGEHAGHVGHGGQDHADHAGQAEQAATPAATSDDAHDPADPCDCIGDCQATQASARADSSPTTEVASCSTADCLQSTEAARLPGTPRFLLPFSNGPPSLG